MTSDGRPQGPTGRAAGFGAGRLPRRGTFPGAGPACSAPVAPAPTQESHGHDHIDATPDDAAAGPPGPDGGGLDDDEPAVAPAGRDGRGGGRVPRRPRVLRPPRP